ncbi:MAG: hypothetical protein Kow00129_04610 [Thermoleophilia bacterium]
MDKLIRLFAGTLLVGTLLLGLALAGVPALGCSDGAPPEKTLAALGAEVGGTAQDETDFNSLLGTYATERYTSETDPELVNYQLYLTAKASDLVLNQAEPPDTIDTEVEVDGEAATVTFTLRSRQGLFAVADVSRIEVDLVDVGTGDLPWRIDEIRLER